LARFGVFEADLHAGELRRQGRSVRLQAKPFQLLAALLERPSDVITREELRVKLWPENTFVEFDDNLNTAVLKLRHALGDSAENPRFVETLPRRGYRFIAPVTWDGERASPGAEVPAPEPSPPQRSRRWRVRAALLAAAAGTLIFLFWLERRSVAREGTGNGARPVVRIVKTTRLTSGAGLEHAPAWSPDGTRVAYASDQLGGMDVWVVHVASGEAMPLTAAHAGYDGAPSWSPDGEWIEFASDRDGGGLFVTSPVGGPARKLVDVPFAPSVELAASVPQAAWAPDGSRLAYTQGLKTNRGLFLLPTEGGTPQSVPLTAAVLGFAVTEPAWSPDGRLLAFASLSGVAATSSRLWTVAPGAAALPVTDGSHLDRSPRWSEATSALLHLGPRRGFGRVIGRMRQDGSPVGDRRSRSWLVWIRSRSSDGRHLAYVKRSNIGVPPVGHDVQSLDRAHPLTAGDHLVENVDVDRQGAWIAFDSNRAGGMDLWVMRTDGTGLRRITRDERPEWYPSFAPDGRSLAYHALVGDQRDLFVVPLDGGPPRRLTEHPAQDWLPRWSPDGAWIAFGSNRGGSADIWEIPATGGAARAVVSHPANDHNPVWSPDGRSLAFSSDRGGSDEVYVIAREGGTPRQITHQGWLDVIAFSWPSSDVMYAWGKTAGADRPEATFWAVSTVDGSARRILQVPEGGRSVSAALASDGRSLYFPVWERIGDLWLADLSEEPQ
jgi:Tol biopolymer transport system component/DNA-binding winged helix-turn-helix (wHTH) protein